MTIQNLLSTLDGLRVVDLAQPYYTGIPHHPAHAPFIFGLNKKHGDYVNPGGGSSASEAIALGAHVGTHIDALCHFSCDGRLHGGELAAPIQSYAEGIGRHTVDHIQPILRRAVLFDIAKQQGLDSLPHDFVITPGHLQATGIVPRKGDVALIRTGWGQFWHDAARFISQVHSPGPKAAAAQWLSNHGIFAAGSDTAPFEFTPSPEMSVHVHLLVEKGVHIVECLNLEELSSTGVTEFLFIATPLRIRGGTGSPIRPIALIPAD
ncbi:MAG: cyclase family protein [Acidobacteriota bacterium]|nr:cyclase family protein [Acidobacteriota bacterium]